MTTANDIIAVQTAPHESSPSGLARLIHLRRFGPGHSAQSKRHSSLVRKLRLLLPLAAIAILVVLLTLTDSNDAIKPLPREQVAPEMVGKNELINPKFQSEDTKQQPYTITATKAFQESGNLDLVTLEKPVADISLKDGSWIALEAKTGKYTQSSGDLSLDDQVKLYHDDGYELRTSHVDINVQSQTATSTTAVSGQGPAGDITASGLKAQGQSGTLIFTGPAKLVLRPSPSDKKDSPETNKGTPAP